MDELLYTCNSKVILQYYYIYIYIYICKYIYIYIYALYIYIYMQVLEHLSHTVQTMAVFRSHLMSEENRLLLGSTPLCRV